jgi:predicted phosphoribosyltransferase
VAPGLPFGAVDEEGHVMIDYATSVALGLGAAEVARIKTEAMVEIARRRVLYGTTPLRHFLPGRTVILVDDGLATGLTMQAAVAHAQRHGAEVLIVVTPCASERAASQVGSLLHRDHDRFVCPIVDQRFDEVGAYYTDFRPVRDEEVAELLRPQGDEKRGKPVSPTRAPAPRRFSSPI